MDPVPDTFAEQRSAYYNSPFLKQLEFYLGDIRPGYVEVLVDAGEKLSNRNHVIHGGVLASLIDNALGQAVRSLVGVGVLIVTAEFKVNFLAPGKLGLLRAVGEVVKPGKTLATAIVTVYDHTGERVAMGLGTLRIFPPKAGQRL